MMRMLKMMMMMKSKQNTWWLHQFETFVAFATLILWTRHIKIREERVLLVSLKSVVVTKTTHLINSRLIKPFIKYLVQWAAVTKFGLIIVKPDFKNVFCLAVVKLRKWCLLFSFVLMDFGQLIGSFYLSLIPLSTTMATVQLMVTSLYWFGTKLLLCYE